MKPGPHLEVSDALRRSVAELGGSAERWLDQVPSRIAEVAGTWDLELGAQLHHEGMVSIVVGVTTREGSPAIFKLSVPHEDARGEATALRCWDGGCTQAGVVRQASATGARAWIPW